MDLVVNGTQIEMMGNKYTLQDGKFVGEENSANYAVDGSKITVLDFDKSKMIFVKE